MNKVGKIGRHQEPMFIEINGHRFSLWRVCIGYTGRNLERRKMVWQVQVANDWNMTNRFFMQSAQIRGLVSKIEGHQYKLVRPT